MPLRVKCPNGCVIRVPSNRAGKVIRCPSCKATIRLGRIVQTQTVSESQTVSEQTQPEPDLTAESKDQDISEPIVVQTGNDIVDFSDIVALPVVAPEDAISIDDRPIVKMETDTKLGSTTADEWENRVRRARGDRILLSRFFAGFLLLVAVINMAPAAYHWYLWSTDSMSHALPRWTYLQIFVAAVIMVYAVFIVQVADWAALKAVSVVLLVLAALFGFLSTGLLLGGTDGVIASFLELPLSLLRSASLWCVAMLILAIMASYLIGREAFNWQRIDGMLDKIVPNPPQAL